MLRDMVLYDFLLSQEMNVLAVRFVVTAFNEYDEALYQIKLLSLNPDEVGYNFWILSCPGW